eukprot:Gregarina_sp_Poly_1__2511@NODE_167_length_12139_cov_61_777005_g148_i0_p12_GENE_NODE_167_length_12139_cov_61_777005_g148_i0NODE_167_length_12139_cov_61_777005_g148_i0_p12_ORF_typecomplete_len112_score6_40ART/PF01129_18/0_0073_NODE_167_length_12139_cov_61_777005_g148_i051275462
MLKWPNWRKRRRIGYWVTDLRHCRSDIPLVTPYNFPFAVVHKLCCRHQLCNSALVCHATNGYCCCVYREIGSFFHHHFKQRFAGSQIRDWQPMRLTPSQTSCRLLVSQRVP